MKCQYGEMPSNMLADVFESLVAAIFLDGGWDEAKRFVLEYIQPEIERVARSDAKGQSDQDPPPSASYKLATSQCTTRS